MLFVHSLRFGLRTDEVDASPNECAYQGRHGVDFRPVARYFCLIDSVTVEELPHQRNGPLV